MHGSPDRAASAARTSGVRMNEDPVEALRSPLPRRPASRRRTRPSPRLGRYPGWRRHRLAFPRAMRSGTAPAAGRSGRADASRVRLASGPMRSLTVAGAAQVGSVPADIAPCFPFNRARSARAPRRRQFRSARDAASRRRADAAQETSRRVSARRPASTNDEDISRREAGVLRLETLQISETCLFRAKMLGL